MQELELIFMWRKNKIETIAYGKILEMVIEKFETIIIIIIFYFSETWKSPYKKN